MPHRLSLKDVEASLADINRGLEAKSIRLAAEKDGKGFMLVKYSGRAVLSRGLTKKGIIKAVEAMKGLTDL